MELSDRGQVFGEWDAPITDDDVPIPTPVGLLCMYCRRAVREGDNGRVDALGQVQHRECCLRVIWGGIGHQVDHERYCHGELGPDAGLSYRQSAILVWQFFQQTRLNPTNEQLAAWRVAIDLARAHQ